MRKIIRFVSALICILLLAGCGKQQQNKELPVPEYPLRKELIKAAAEKCGLPGNLTIEENELLKYEGIESTSYTLRHPTKDLFAGFCLGILTHKSAEFTSLGLSFSTIDQTEEFTTEEIEQAIRFGTYLFWQDEDDTRIHEAFIKEYVYGQPLLFEIEIDGIDCQIAYTPSHHQPKLKIAFSTDMETQLEYIKAQANSISP